MPEKTKVGYALLHDYRHQLQIEQAELRRLKAMYTRSRLELNGDYLFVPVITKDGGQTSFQWNARDATDYYGYDLGESSGYLHAGATWTQPLAVAVIGGFVAGLPLLLVGLPALMRRIYR